MGEDFHFGHGRGGNVELLREMGAELGFEVVARGAARAGPFRPPPSAGPARGRVRWRPQRVAGPVPRGAGRRPQGDKRARDLGTRPPTWVSPTRSCPGPGHLRRLVPAAWGGPTAMSLGRRPTFTTGRRVLEAYLLDFAGDLYGGAARVQFVARLRAE